MSFELRVDFIGVMLFVRDESGRVAVVMPDATLQSKLAGRRLHFDAVEREPHVGFMGFDAAHLKSGISVASRTPADSDDPPVTELVHRFHRQTMRFELPDAGNVSSARLELPGFGEFAPHLQPSAQLFRSHTDVANADGEGNVYHPVLMRTLLTGGTLETPDHPDSMPMSSIARWSGTDAPYPAGASTIESILGRYYGQATWIRTVDASSVKVVLNDLDGRNASSFDLFPIGDAAPRVSIRVINLCCENPMGWPELADGEGATEDTDFKYLYELFDAPGGRDWADVLDGCRLPAPREMGMMGRGRGTPPVRCGGGMVAYRGLPAIEAWDKA